jgi:hypothetical protein
LYIGHVIVLSASQSILYHDSRTCSLACTIDYAYHTLIVGVLLCTRLNICASGDMSILSFRANLGLGRRSGKEAKKAVKDRVVCVSSLYAHTHLGTSCSASSPSLLPLNSAERRPVAVESSCSVFNIPPATFAMTSGNKGEINMGIPPALTAGTPMQKISSKKIKQVVIKITEGSITWAGSGDSKSEWVQNCACELRCLQCSPHQPDSRIASGSAAYRQRQCITLDHGRLRSGEPVESPTHDRPHR